MDDDDFKRGRRDHDAEPLTVKEALVMFALRAEHEAQTREIMDIKRMGIPRETVELRWRLDDERYSRIETQMRNGRMETQEKLEKFDSTLGKISDKIDKTHEDLVALRLPRWAIVVLGILAGLIGPLVAALIAHTLAAHQ